VTCRTTDCPYVETSQANTVYGVVRWEPSLMLLSLVGPAETIRGDNLELIISTPDCQTSVYESIKSVEPFRAIPAGNRGH
jgi:hypothetical protein